jgi:hypothetical protein
MSVAQPKRAVCIKGKKNVKTAATSKGGMASWGERYIDDNNLIPRKAAQVKSKGTSATPLMGMNYASSKGRSIA